MKTLIADANNVDTSATYVAAAATKDGSLLVAYIPPAHKGSIPVEMSALSNKANAYWFDPASGIFISAPGSPFKNKGVQSFTPPVKNSAGETDWVLMLSVKKR
jgi:hypothetical protein